MAAIRNTIADIAQPTAPIAMLVCQRAPRTRHQWTTIPAWESARLGEQTGAAVDRSGRVAVLADCTLPGHPEVFVIGDLMSLDDLPGVAEVAMQSGRHAARSIVRRLRGDDTTREFRYRDLGTMATISRFRAVAWFGPVRLGGPVAWLLWLVVHLAFLTGFKNRVATLASWTVAFLGRGRPERTITEQQVFARTRSLPELTTAVRGSSRGG
jgi:NADH dehydrogenase